MSNKSGRITTSIMRKNRSMLDVFDFRHFILLAFLISTVLGVNQYKIEREKAHAREVTQMVIQYAREDALKKKAKIAEKKGLISLYEFQKENERIREVAQRKRRLEKRSMIQSEAELVEEEGVQDVFQKAYDDKFLLEEGALEESILGEGI